MGPLYDQIPVIQQSMVSLWSLDSEHRPKAERDVQIAVADLKIQMCAGKQQRASFFSPIRRLPEMLAIWQLVTTTIPR